MKDKTNSTPLPEDLSASTSTSSNNSAFNWWRRTLSYQTGLGLTEQEKLKYEQEAKIKKEKSQCTRCDEYRDWMLTFSPTVIFLKDHVTKLGGNINKKTIQCQLCDEWRGGGFSPESGILLCANRIYSKWHLEDTLAHELIHAYDFVKFDFNPMNLRHAACSEIRASSLSGECRMSLRWNQLEGTFARGHQECVKRRAVLSLKSHPECKDESEAKRLVNEVWDSCFNDTRPFDHIYK